MAARYQHVSDAIRREVAGRLDGVLWTSEEGDLDDTSDHN
jgi:hypothetical protein